MRRAQTSRVSPFLAPREWAIVSAVLWLVLNFFCLERFPTVFIDEAENANHAYNAAFHGHAVFSLYDDLYPSRLKFLRQSWPPVIRPFFVQSLAIFIKRVGFSLFRVRLFSLSLGFLCLLLVYETGVILSRPALGMGALAILGTYFPFLYSCHSIRPEIFLAFDGLCLFLALLVALRNNHRAAYLLAGVLAGIAPGFHTNGAAFTVPLFLILLFSRRWRGLLWGLIGWMTGALLFIHFADWERFLPGYGALFFREFTTPPLLASRGHFLKIALDESQRYFGSWIFGQWAGGLLFNRLLSIQHVFLGGAVLWGCVGPLRKSEKLAAVFATSLAIAYAFLVGQKASNYLTALAPFFALSAAAWLLYYVPLLLSAGQLNSKAKAIHAGVVLAGWIVFSITAVGAISLIFSISSYQPSFKTWTQRLSARIPITARVAGPQILWLGMSSYDYRDAGVLVWYRLLLNEKNLWKPLEGWKPDYLILDASLAARLAHLAQEPHQPAMLGPTGFLPWPHEVMDYFLTGPAYGDAVALIHIHWPRGLSK